MQITTVQSCHRFGTGRGGSSAAGPGSATSVSSGSDPSAGATRWLQVLTKHLGIDMRNLPDDPGLDANMREGMEIDADKEYEIASELVLVSLALVVGDAQEVQEKNRLRKQDSTDPKTAKDDTPPLDYTALSRSLIVRTCAALQISHDTVVEAEKALAQHLFFEMQAKEQQSDKANGKWDEATQQYKQEKAKKGNTLKWAATGAGFVLGGVAIGLTGGKFPPRVGHDCF